MKEAGYRGKYSFLRLILGDMKDLHGGLIHKLVFDAQSFQGTFSMGKQNNGHFSLFCGFGFVLDYFAFLYSIQVIQWFVHSWIQKALF